ncbi:MAG TPA: AsmA-like C-terminal region-containing protein [Methylovirgula sp.]|nr:AsmA-like C-terminal region-containing protein [Methylovirgula sp.]
MSLAKKIALFFVALAVAIGAADLLSRPVLAEILALRIHAASGLHAKIRAAKLVFSSPPKIVADDVTLNSPQGWSLSADHIHFGFAWEDLFDGKMNIADLSLERPVLQITQQALDAEAAHRDSFALGGTLTARDGRLVYRNLRRDMSAEIQSIALVATPREDGGLALRFGGKLDGTDLRLDGALHSVSDFIAGRATAFEGTDTRGARLHARLRLGEGSFGFDDLALSASGGTLHGAGFFRWTGEAPRLEANIDADRLDLGALQLGADHPIDLKDLRLLDGALTLKAGTLSASGIQARKIAIAAKLDKGRLTSSLAAGDFYAGKADADLAIDAAQPSPKEKLKADFSGVQAAQLLNLAGVEGQGTLSAAFDLASEGAEIKTIANGLAGTAELDFTNGTVSGLSTLLSAVAPFLPKIGNLDKIAINSAHARFAVATGEADTDDIRIASPVLDVSGKGTIDLVGETLDLHFEPKLAGGANSDRPTDLGTTILLRGPWNAPRVSADVDTGRAIGNLLGGPGGAAIMKGLGALLNSLSGAPDSPQ